MNEQHLNLTRLYRVVRFGAVIGQDLVVRMLQNSLYTDQIFPVYLMSGKHGCGKTSVARIFASAANCSQIGSFRLNPKEIDLPCQKCGSCIAMREATHPDFIEIDAASHTGVDMIRSLIETASFLPVMGVYKVYLIDEAHMLSKAAFNALLKILEEPPKTVFFILATTDVQKIPETVRSRCFQLFFKSVGSPVLVEYLTRICDLINISYTVDGINCIVDYSGGSVRDALNVVERIRYASQTVDRESVKAVVGFIDDSLLLEMIQSAWLGNMNYFKERFFSLFSVQIAVGLVWSRLIFVLHEVLKWKMGITSENASAQLQSVSQQVSLGFVYNFLNMLFDYEPLLLKTSAPIILLHTVVLKNIRSVNDSSLITEHCEPHEFNSNGSVAQLAGSDRRSLLNEGNDQKEFRSLWGVFVKKIEHLAEPLLHSLFIKIIANFDAHENRIDLSFAVQEEFLKDLLVEHQKKWLPLLYEVFGSAVSFTLQCSFVAPILQNNPNGMARQGLLEAKKNLKNNLNDSNESSYSSGNMQGIPSVKIVLKYFPGRVLFFES